MEELINLEHDAGQGSILLARRSDPANGHAPTQMGVEILGTVILGIHCRWPRVGGIELSKVCCV